MERPFALVDMNTNTGLHSNANQYRCKPQGGHWDQHYLPWDCSEFYKPLCDISAPGEPVIFPEA